MLVRLLDDTPELNDAGIRVLEAAIEEIGAKLLVLDPLNAFLPDRVDTRTDHHIRRALKPLAALAERTGVAVVVIRHLNKSGGHNPKYRGGGSIGIFGAARASLLAAPDPDDPTRKLLARNKGNLGPPVRALAYELVQVGDTARVAWKGFTDHSARDLLVEREDPEEQTRLHEAMETISRLLAHGPMPVTEVRRRCRPPGSPTAPPTAPGPVSGCGPSPTAIRAHGAGIPRSPTTVEMARLARLATRMAENPL
jgi:AAA domain